MFNIKKLFPLLFVLIFSFDSYAQDIPDEYGGVVYRGQQGVIARGVLDGNLIETNFRNHGEMSRWNDLPWGVWPRGVGGRHIDGVGMIVAAYVPGERRKYSDFYGDVPDTLLNPVIINYRDAGKRQSPVTGELWGWLPLPGFNNPERVDPITEQSSPTPALSDDPTSWPDFWPDRINEEIFGWAGSWNGLFGRGVLNADLESYYVMDDFSDLEYGVNPETGQPLSPFGVFYPSPSDSTMGGLGTQTSVRILQWANVLAEDTMFLLYRINNKGEYDHRDLYFVQIVDYGLGNEETDDNASYDPLLDVVYGWDSNGIGTPTTGGGNYELGYTGFAFLESPANDDDLLDNDEDGITDESRFDENYFILVGENEILNYVNSNYNVPNFEVFNGPVEERPAFRAGVWFTTDENLDWVGFDDKNGNGQVDDGEVLNNDVGRDGLGVFDLGYLGPDEGEGDGIPTQGEPNYNELDVDESDQIGLRGFDLNTRPFYESGNNLRDDTWLFERIIASEFPLGSDVPSFDDVVNDEPFALFMSGPVALAPGETDFFSTAWIFGEDEDDFFRNRRTVQNIYNADYNFAQPPLTPTLSVEAGDRRVTLSWDNISVDSFDRFLQEFDFEGYRLYKGTNNILSDARTITDVNGVPTFYEPLAQWDLDNGINGPKTVLEGRAVYYMGDDTGLQFNYVDTDVINGKTYYYALVAYDRGIEADPSTGSLGIDPQENVFNISIDLSGQVLGSSINAGVVTPLPSPAGFREGGSTVDLSQVTQGTATGGAAVNIAVRESIDESKQYRINFFDSLSATADYYLTTDYELVELTSSDTLIERSPMVESTPIIDGFSVDFFNDPPASIDEDRTGYIANEGTENELFGLNPVDVDGIDSDWILEIDKNISGSGVNSNYDYELLFVDPADSVYTPPRVLGGVFTSIDIPVFARNLTLDEPAIIFVEDRDSDGQLSLADALYIADPDGRRYTQRYIITFSGVGQNPPDAGDKIRISSTRAFGQNDSFEFGVVNAELDNDLAAQELDDIYVVPNPYVAAAEWERAQNRDQVGRGERKIYFYNVPQTCTIRIFNIRGELIKTINHSGTISEGAVSWDLKSDNNEDIAYGVYFYHVQAPGVGEYTDKFAIIK
ncbi:hypothetical protein AB2B38_002975 [Balneola sp. MJW-20]|uniref:hypothetical protein n=1 Tax=Gracilimonas aurantiaca TaxID=3234185 RepID=UPI003466C9F9